MASMIDVVNTIRDNASTIYQERVPEATQANIAEVGAAITDGSDAVVMNEFCDALINMIITPHLISKKFDNPLKPLKKGKKAFGDTIEEIYVNFVQAKGFDPTGAELLQREMPDVKTVFHRMNRQDKYKITISPEALAKAFRSEEGLTAFVQNIIGTLKNSAELDEFVLTKQLIKDALDNNAIKTVSVADPLLSEANGKAFIKAIKTVSGDMVYPNSNNNAYLTAQSTDNKAIITKSDLNEQILIIDNPTNVSVAVDVLASAFNMSVVEFNNTRKIVIDAFPDENVRAVLVDKEFFQIYDDLYTTRSFENGEGLYRNYYLHVWQTLAYSILVNAVAFVVGSDADNDGTVESFSVSTELADGVSISNTRKTVTEGKSYSATLTGATGKSVSVKMGSSDITNTAYASSTGKISIASVTGNITIEVA